LTLVVLVVFFDNGHVCLLSFSAHNDGVFNMLNWIMPQLINRGLRIGSGSLYPIWNLFASF